MRKLIRTYEHVVHSSGSLRVQDPTDAYPGAYSAAVDVPKI